jgi:mevalonate kinase
MFGLNLTNKEIFDLSYKTVLDIQKKGSGVDVAAAVYGGTLYFLTAGKIIEQLSIKDFPLVVGYSGIKADTVTLVNQVKDKFKNKQKQLDQIYDEIAKIVNEARQALLEKNFDLFGQLMNVNQDFLNQLGVSIQKLDIMINSAKDAGAYGAKLSGAGGGDCMIAMSPEKTKAKIQKAIEKVGGEIIKVKVNAKGVRIES